MPELHADLFSRHASPLEGYFFVVVDETGSRCYVRRDLSSKQRKTGKEEAWRPKCAAPSLGYEQSKGNTLLLLPGSPKCGHFCRDNFSTSSVSLSFFRRFRIIIATWEGRREGAREVLHEEA